MKFPPISRRSVLYAIVITVLFLSIPRAILQVIRTGDPYLFSERFFQDMLARLSGPGRLRFLFQPTVAIILGARDGWKDARSGSAPFLWALVCSGDRRFTLLRSAFTSVQDLVLLAILLDIVFQFLIFHNVHPGAALLLGPILITTPYALSRAFSNRIARLRTHAVPAASSRRR